MRLSPLITSTAPAGWRHAGPLLLASLVWANASAAAPLDSTFIQAPRMTVKGESSRTQKAATSGRQGSKAATLRSPSEETRSERDRRLTRECRGRPNAGACLGYARP